MKLRNKKTGVIIEDSDLGDILSRYAMPSYDSIAELCEEWEDYTPAEPLIKDEKVRKAVRAWAEASGVKKVEPRGVGDTLLYFIGEDKDKQLIEIEFYANVDDYTHLARKDTYTIAELCGEEQQ